MWMAPNVWEVWMAPNVVAELVAELAKQEKQRLEPEINWIVWSVLTRSQYKELNRTLGVNIRVPQPAPGSEPEAPERQLPSTRHG